MVVTRVRPRSDAGLTVVELLITLIIASIVASSTFVFFAGQQRIYETQTKILNVQQNVWAAMETLGRFVRSAGTGMSGCIRPDPDGPGGPLLGDPGPVGTALAPPATGLRAFRNGQGALRIPPLWIVNGAGGAPDSITVAYGQGTFGNFRDTPLGATVTLSTDPITTLPPPPAPLNPFTSMFRPGEFIVLVDATANPANGIGDRGCSLFQITAVNAVVNQLAHSIASEWNPGVAVPAHVAFPFPGGAAAGGGIRHFGQLIWVQFTIGARDDDGDGNFDEDGDGFVDVPALMMTRLDLPVGNPNRGPQVLAEGIEDLQVAFACDTNPPAALPGAASGDGILTESTPPDAADEWLLNAAGDVPGPACNRPSAIRLTLIARSLSPDNTLTSIANAKPAVEDGAPGAPDTFRHRVISTTIFPRN